MTSDPLLTVIICTYDRPNLLETAVRRTLEQDLETKKYNIIVVFDPSTPKTAKTVDSLSAASESVREIAETRSGLSVARNTGLREATGEYVVFLDDDAIPSDGWLSALMHAFETTTPTPLCVGGPVTPRFETSPPDWLPDSYPGLPTCDLGTESKWIDFPEEYIIGANMAFERAYLLEAGGFPTEVGRVKGKLLANEELEVFYDVDNRSGIYYTPEASVEHVIPSDRLRLHYFFRRFYWQGVSDCRSEYLRQATPPSRKKALQRFGWNSLRAGKTAIRTLWTTNNDTRMTAFFSLFRHCGYALEQTKFILRGNRHWS